MGNYLAIALVWFCYVIRLNDEQMKIVKITYIIINFKIKHKIFTKLN